METEIYAGDVVVTKEVDTKTIKEADLSDTETNVTGDKKIAPGTGGEVTIQLTNVSEVTVNYDLTIVETQENTPDGKVIPIEYSLDKERK